MLTRCRDGFTLRQNLTVRTFAIQVSSYELQDIGIASRVKGRNRTVLMLGKMRSGSPLDLNSADNLTGDKSVQLNARISVSVWSSHLARVPMWA